MSELEGFPNMSCGRWIIGGDWNAHDVQWDELVNSDDRGLELSDWVEGRGLVVCNDGTVTREERSSSRRSTPDVTIVNMLIQESYTWKVY